MNSASSLLLSPPLLNATAPLFTQAPPRRLHATSKTPHRSVPPCARQRRLHRRLRIFRRLHPRVKGDPFHHELCAMACAHVCAVGVDGDEHRLVSGGVWVEVQRQITREALVQILQIRCRSVEM